MRFTITKRLQSFLIATLTILILCLMPTQPAFASDANGITNENQGVSTVLPDDSAVMEIIKTRGSTPPSTNRVWTSRYNFSGTSYTGGDLYTNYWFTGRSTYFVSATNTGANNIKVAAWKEPRQLVSEVTVRPGETYNYFIRGLNSSNKIVLQFRATSLWQPFSFSGYIE